MKIKKPIVLTVIVLLIAAAVAVVAAVALSLGGDTPSDDTGALEKEPAKAPEIDDLVEKKFEGSLPAFIAAFGKRGNLSEKEIEEIRRIIEK